MNRAADQPEPNPLREGLSTRAVPQPCAIVIFGATGDLTHRKLIPALYNLAADGELPAGVAIVGFARRNKSDDEFRRDLEEATRKYFAATRARRNLEDVCAIDFYHQSEFDDESGYKSLAKRLDEIDKNYGTARQSSFLFCSRSRSSSNRSSSILKAAGLNEDVRRKLGSRNRRKTVRHRSRLSARAQSDRPQRFYRRANLSDRSFPRQRNGAEHSGPAVLRTRFSRRSGIRRYVDHVQITAAETLGVEDSRGLLRTRRRFARHGAEPSAPAPLSCRDGTAHGSGR